MRKKAFQKSNTSKRFRAIFGVAATTLALTSAGLPTLVAPFSLLEANVAYGAKRTPSGRQDSGQSIFSKVTYELEGIELLSFLESYSELFNFSFFVDRRVDPSIRLSGSASDEPFIKSLNSLLGNADLSFCVVDDSLLYVGPSGAAGEALLLFAMKTDGYGLENAPRQVEGQLFKTIDFQIPQYSEPREVFKSFAQKSRLKLSGYEKTPFDIWRGADIQAVSANKLLTLLGLGFNVDYRFDSTSSTLKAVALDRDAEITRYYPESAVKTINKREFPECSFESQNQEGQKVLKTTGPFSAIASIEQEVAKETLNIPEISESERGTSRNGSSRLGKKKVQVSGEVSNVTLKSLFDYLEKQSQITCAIDPSLASAGVTLDVRVSCKFTNANIDQIANIIANEIGAVADVDGTTITFHKK